MAKEESGTKRVVDTRPAPGVGTSFDELAKGLASGTVSRGQALRWMGGALVGAALAAVPGVAWAEGGRCSEGQTRCNDRCVNLQNNENHCGSCRNRCASNQTCCKGRCVNLKTNERHCGSCFHRCEDGQECVGGMCDGGGGCPDGRPQCGTQCCSTGETCVHGTICCPNARVCDPGTSATCCAETQECVGGVCRCPPDPACTEESGGNWDFSVCACLCSDGIARCGNVCCEPGETCVDGVCGPCPPGETVCTGCACETLVCQGTSGAATGCNPSAVSGGFCYAAGEGVGTVCACGFGACVSDCSECANIDPSFVCVIEPRCAEVGPGLGFQCVVPC
jgi:hypothetical protein